MAEQEQDLEPDDTQIHLDEASLYRILKVSKGDRNFTLRLINEAGRRMSLCELDSAIERSSILRAYFGEGSTLVEESGVDPESALLRLPSSTDSQLSGASMERVVAAQDEYLMARGLEGVGMSTDDIREMESMAQFVGHGFKKTVDMTHGIMVTQLWKLHKRADEIREILNNTEESERITVTEKGDVIRYNAPRFSDEEKLEWQKEYTNVVDQIRRISDSAHQGAAIRLKADVASRQASEKGEKRKNRKRLKRASKDDD